ncbi:MAG: hypothetical protein ACKOPU_05715 [Candidatus Planktophila sp.]
MKLKTTPIQILERGLPIQDSCDICLSGTEQVCEYFPELRYQKEGPCSAKNSFMSAFGLDHKFYYRLEKYNNRVLIDLEIGIGHLYQESPSVILLKRLQPLLYKHGSDPIGPTFRPVNAFMCHDKDDYLVVQSYHAQSLPELLIDSNSLVVSSEDNPLNILNIEENSVVGRLDGQATSISIYDLLSRIASYTKQIVLSCSQLDVKKLKTKILQLIPSKSTQAKKGSLIYNEENDTIEYFDGSRWRTLLWRFTDE